VGLPFTGTPRDHWKVINWPNFNIDVSWGIGRPEERRRDGGTASILAWKIPWTDEPGRLQSMGVSKELDMT